LNKKFIYKTALACSILLGAVYSVSVTEVVEFSTKAKIILILGGWVPTLSFFLIKRLIKKPLKD
jgi:lipopolysaccharide export LptBFGC system permease protein LptF